jgi:hypothetical protein
MALQLQVLTDFADSSDKARKSKNLTDETAGTITWGTGVTTLGPYLKGKASLAKNVCLSLRCPSLG